MAKKIKVSEFRNVVRRIIKEEKQKMQKQPLNENFLRQIIKEEMSMMDEMSMIKEDATMQVDFGLMRVVPKGQTFTINNVFKGQIGQTRGSQALIELVAETKGMVGNPALNKVAKEALMKYIRLTDQGLFIDPRVEEGIPLIDATNMKAQRARLARLKARYEQVKDSRPELAARIMNGTPDNSGIRDLERNLQARNLKWTFSGKILLPQNVQPNRV